MDAQTVLRIKPALTQYLHEFDRCMGRVPNRRHLETYVTGQLSDLQRKSIEPLADAAGQAPRTLQQFLAMLRWDEGAMRDRLQRRVARRHAHSHSIGILDETSFPKQGKHTACVQRQHCGARGKQDNCVVSVHLGYAAGDFHTLLDGELYLPEKTWHNDRKRCHAAGIPDEVVYRPKWVIGLGQIQRALSHGVRFSWLTFDEGYGGKPPFLRGLEALGQNYVAEIPVSFVVWTKPPEVMYREHHADGCLGRPRKLPRLKIRSTPACEVRNLLTYSPKLRRLPWLRYRVKDGEKGPMVWEAKCIPVWIKDEQGLPVGPYRLLIARNALKPEEVKFFLSNAPEGVPAETLSLAAFSRWRIERLFEDTKDELGMDHFEVRRYVSIQRHLILTCVSHLFLAEFRQEHRGEKSGTDRLPSADGDQGLGAPVESQGAVLPRTRGGHRGAIGVNAGANRRRPTGPPQADHPAITRDWRQTHGPTHLPLVAKVA